MHCWVVDWRVQDPLCWPTPRVNPVCEFRLGQGAHCAGHGVSIVLPARLASLAQTASLKIDPGANQLYILRLEND